MHLIEAHPQGNWRLSQFSVLDLSINKLMRTNLVDCSVHSTNEDSTPPIRGRCVDFVEGLPS
jgi:hypothetical protein